MTHFYLAHWLFHLSALEAKQPRGCKGWGAPSIFPRPPPPPTRAGHFGAFVLEPLHMSFWLSARLLSSPLMAAFTKVAQTLPPPGSLLWLPPPTTHSCYPSALRGHLASAGGSCFTQYEGAVAQRRQIKERTVLHFTNEPVKYQSHTRK